MAGQFARGESDLRASLLCDFCLGEKFVHTMLSGRAGTASAIPSGSGGVDAWGLFGADDAAAPNPDAPQNAPPPRASSHPFFASARFAWSSDAPFDRDAMTRALLDAVQDLARRCERRGRMERSRDALRECGSSDAGASEVIAAAVDALQSTADGRGAPTDDDASLLNECILTARGIKCLEAMARSPLEGIEAAVLLSEHATHTADAGSDRHAWVGTMYAAASKAALRFADERDEARTAQYPPGLKPWALMPPPAKYMGNDVFMMTNREVDPCVEVPRKKADACGKTAFYNEHLRPAVPVVIEGIGVRDGWAAVKDKSFCDLRWLRERFGEVCVPVEVGRRTADGAGGTSRWMLLREFIDDFLSTADDSLDTPARRRGGPGAAVGYVSQHSLLHQCDGLQEHFSVPEQCMGRLAAANAWLGTFGTTTHLHTDEADNMLCQIGGHKLVRLWPPEVGDACFHAETRGGHGAYNKFSPVDAEKPDLEKFPAYAGARGRCLVAVLGPDDSLFIPKGWWHHVRALTPSFSLNFWF